MSLSGRNLKCDPKCTLKISARPSLEVSEGVSRSSRDYRILTPNQFQSLEVVKVSTVCCKDQGGLESGLMLSYTPAGLWPGQVATTVCLESVAGIVNGTWKNPMSVPSATE